MKQYVHPMNWMVAHGFKTDFAEWYKISNWEWLLVFWDEWISEMVLLEFWFIEKEEEPDTDTKCIPSYIRWKTYREWEVVACKNCGGDCTDKYTPKCPQTDTKWIEDVYKDLNRYYDLTLDMLEDSILLHIPKQWKLHKTPTPQKPTQT